MLNTNNSLESKFEIKECECRMCHHQFTENEIKNIQVRCNKENRLHVMFKGICPNCCYDSLFSYYAHVQNGVFFKAFGVDYLQQRPACYKARVDLW